MQAVIISSTVAAAITSDLRLGFDSKGAGEVI
jgi:hypothetical protein